MSFVSSSADREPPVIGQLDAFDANSGSRLERLLFNHRRIVVALCVLLTVGLGIASVGLRLNAAFDKMIPTGHPFIVNFLANKSKMAVGGNSLRIAVEARSGNIFDAGYLATLRQLNDELFLMPGVDRPYMKSLWTPATRWTGVTEDGLDGGPVIPDDYDASPASIAQVKANVERSGEIGQVVADDFRSSMILVPLQESLGASGKPLDYGDMQHRLETLRDKYGNDKVRIHITGFAKIVGDLIDGVRQVIVFFAIAIAICTGVLLWYTRCLRSTALVVTCSLVAVIWLLGMLRLLGYTLDPYSVLVPFLVFAIGMSHGAQKMNGIMQDIARGTHRLVAARYTFRRLFLAGVTALLADAVGFAVLMIIDIRVIQDLAVTASIGVAALIVTNLVLLPVLLSFTGVSKAAAQRRLPAEAGARAHVPEPWLWRCLARFTRRRWAIGAIAVSVVLGAIGFATSLHLRIGDTDPGAPELRADSRYNRDNRFVVANYGASSDNYVVMVRTPQYACGQYDTLLTVDALETELRRLPGVVTTQSLAGISKGAASAMNEGSLKWYDIPRTQDMLNTIVTRAPRELIDQACDLLTVSVYLHDHKADTLTRVVDTVTQFAAVQDTHDVRIQSAGGNAGIEAATNIVVRQANMQMLGLVYAAVVLLAFITFRSWRAVICAVLPLMLTSVLCEALMVCLGIGVKVATLPVIALGVGIGVDYALYVLTVTLAHLRRGVALEEAYAEALRFTGRVVVLTGATLGIAVATWAFSAIKFQADMGILLAFMFVWNMVGALVLLPALAHFLLRPAAANACIGESVTAGEAAGRPGLLGRT